MVALGDRMMQQALKQYLQTLLQWRTMRKLEADRFPLISWGTQDASLACLIVHEQCTV